MSTAQPGLSAKKELQRTISVFHRSLRSGVTIYANLRGRPYFIT